MDGYQESYKEKHVQVDYTKSMFFLISANQNRYSLLLKKLIYGDNVGRYEYPVMTILALDILIHTEFWIRGHQ